MTEYTRSPLKIFPYLHVKPYLNMETERPVGGVKNLLGDTMSRPAGERAENQRREQEQAEGPV